MKRDTSKLSHDFLISLDFADVTGAGIFRVHIGKVDSERKEERQRAHLAHLRCRRCVSFVASFSLSFS